MTVALVTVIADSISEQSIRITTFQLRYWRPIHSELMTHREFSRCAGSSRARKSQAIIDQVRRNPWMPVEWGKDQAGMQAKQLLDGLPALKVHDSWLQAAYDASEAAQVMNDIGAHKQIVNRILEPFTYIDVVVTSTSYDNWFGLRDHPDADPTIRDLAVKMRKAYNSSEPKLLFPGEWHLPYMSTYDWIDAQEYVALNDFEDEKLAVLEVVKKVSTARCARTSYKAHDGTNTTVAMDLALYDRLVGSEPLHASPTEHQATPDILVGNNWVRPDLHGNFTGWKQFRKYHKNEYIRPIR